MRKLLRGYGNSRDKGADIGFVPEEILRDFELKEVKKECGVYRLYMDEKDDR